MSFWELNIEIAKCVFLLLCFFIIVGFGGYLLQRYIVWMIDNCEPKEIIVAIIASFIIPIACTILFLFIKCLIFHL